MEPLKASGKAVKAVPTTNERYLDGLAGGPSGGFPVACAADPGNDGQKPHAKGGDHAENQPAYRAGGAYRRGSLSAKRAHHGGVDILHGGLHHLLHNGGPGQP